jgi:hypothetical protein
MESDESGVHRSGTLTDNNTGGIRAVLRAHGTGALHEEGKQCATDGTGGGKPLFSYNLARRGVKHGDGLSFLTVKRGSYGGYFYTQGNLKNPWQ